MTLMSMYDGIKRVFFVGIKGAGVSGLAQILAKQGFHVSGWDTPETFFTDEILKRAEIPLITSWPPEQLDLPDLVIYSNAFPKTHPVRQWFTARGVTQVAYAKAVADIFNVRFGILITGSHGKSTTTALVADLLLKMHQDATALVGTEILEWRTNASVGKSALFVLEGDEYAEAFKFYKPKILVILNVDWDHPDQYQSAAAYEASFRDLITAQPPETRILGLRGDPVLKKLLSPNDRRVVWFGGQDLDLKMPTSLPGKHNLNNVAATLKVAEVLGLDEGASRAAVESFGGTRRRLESYGLKRENIACWDDYAHHPTEVRATLTALRERSPDKPLWLVFQPHTYSRTVAFFKDFVDSLSLADKVLLLPIYGSAREHVGQVNSKDLAQALGGRAEFASNFDEAINYLEKVPSGAILVTMGAGDVWKIHQNFN